MAKSTAEAKPAVKGKGKAAVEETPAKAARAVKSTPDFTVDEVWDLGRAFSKDARKALTTLNEGVTEYAEKANADEKTYRDHITPIKYVQRRVDRISLSLDELDAGIKARKPREAKPKTVADEAPAKTKVAKPAKGKAPKVEEDDDEDEDDDLD